MSDPTPLLPDDLSAGILALPGVADVFPVGAVRHVRETIAAVVAVDTQAVNRITVTTTTGTTRVRARISADSHLPAPVTGRVVADALLQRIPHGDGAVDVQIAHIA